MEQIFMFEIFVKKIILKVDPPVKDEWEIAQEAEEKRREEEALALLLASSKKKPKPPKPPKAKKGKKAPAPPSEEELKYAQTCTVQANCLPLFEFYVAHDNFVAPPPPEPPGKKKAKPKKKGKKPAPFKVELPSEPLPQPPFFGVGNACIFLSRPSKLKEILQSNPLKLQVWNRNVDFNCVGFCNVNWHESFFKCLDEISNLNPLNLDAAEYRDTSTPHMMTNTVELLKPLLCEEDLKESGEVHFYIRLTCLGNKIVSYFINLPEMDRLPGRKYLNDALKLKDVEVVRHWQGTFIEDVPPVAYFFGAPDIMKSPIRPEEPVEVFDDFVAPYTNSELAILAMGFPKGPCGGTNCPKRMDYRGSQHQFIQGETVRGKYHHGSFVNKRDVHGPCGRLDCPLAKKVRNYICNEGAYKTCRKPCTEEYY